MQTKQRQPRLRQGPYRRDLRLSPQGKCRLLEHTRSDDEERPICLHCPLPRCILDGGRWPTPPPPAPTPTRGRGRPASPLVAARNATILQLSLQGYLAPQLAARFSLSPHTIRQIRYHAKQRFHQPGGKGSGGP